MSLMSIGKNKAESLKDINIAFILQTLDFKRLRATYENFFLALNLIRLGLNVRIIGRKELPLGYYKCYSNDFISKFAGFIFLIYYKYRNCWGKSLLIKHLHDLFKKYRFDITFIDFPDNSISYVARNFGSKIIAIDADSPMYSEKVFEDLNPDLILTCNKDTKYNINHIFFPPSCPTEIFYPLFTKREKLISFTGSYHSATFSREKGYDFILKPLIEKYGKYVFIYGYGWKKKEIYKNASIMGFKKIYELNEIYNTTIINLNIHADLARNSGAINFRTFEILGTKSFMLMDNAKGLKYLDFENKRDLVVSNSKEETLELVEYYLNNEEEREKIARNGYEKILKNHTIKHRAVQLIEIIKKLV